MPPYLQLLYRYHLVILCLYSLFLDGKWDLTVLAPDCQLEDGREVAPGIMLDHHGKEVLK